VGRPDRPAQPHPGLARASAFATGGSVPISIDNELYDHLASTWWEERGFLHLLLALTPSRFGYMRRVLLDQLRLDPARCRVLDVGCGGGLLAEEFARQGFVVTGVDPSAGSIAAARAHASQAGLALDYHQAVGEALPFAEETFDVVYCCDVLEHVTDLDRVIAESARVLKPGGVYLYDTINRTFRSWLVVIGLLQEWRWSSLMPPRLHDWGMFIRPDELSSLLARHGLRPAEIRGLKPRAGLVTVLRALRARKRGQLTYLQAVAAMDLAESADTSLLYLGHAEKPTRRSPISP
jgi:2-polyprenyl-6-hydroxyphenyl methylase / 3-demethylubiquinone-9 3-methyltransferase